MSSQIWIALSNGLKNLRLTTSLQSRFLEVQAGTQTEYKKPKRPVPPYFRFMAKVRGDLMEQNPTLSYRDLLKLIGEKWTKLDDASKEYYKVAFQEEMVPYNSEKLKYDESVPAEFKQRDEQSKLEKQIQKDARNRRARLANLGKPKKPSTPYLQFFKENFTSNGQKGRENVVDQTKNLSTQWKTLSDADKAPYITKYKKDIEAYNSAISKWEEVMLKQGNEDLVRKDRLPQKSRSTSDKH